MTHYTAVLIHGDRGGEGSYTFEGDDGLLSKTPVKVMRAFMEYLDEHAHLGHIEYVVNAAMKNKELGVVTVLGELEFGDANDQPFMCMISKSSA